MKKKIMFLNIFIFILCICLLFSTNSFATGDLDYYSGGDFSNSGDIRDLVGVILSAIRIAGGAIAFIILAVIATKYILSSADGKADIKQNLLPYFIGAIVLFGASSIVDKLYEIFSGISST